MIEKLTCVYSAAIKMRALSDLFVKFPTLKAKYGKAARVQVKRVRESKYHRSPFSWDAHVDTFAKDDGKEFKK